MKITELQKLINRITQDEYSLWDSFDCDILDNTHSVMNFYGEYETIPNNPVVFSYSPTNSQFTLYINGLLFVNQQVVSIPTNKHIIDYIYANLLPENRCYKCGGVSRVLKQVYLHNKPISMCFHCFKNIFPDNNRFNELPTMYEYKEIC